MAEATKKRVNRASQPITRHPLFPAIVALWFATLVGLGSFVLRTSLIENFVIAAHIDSLVPAAAPPLGTTARLMLAGVFGLIGGTIGWVLAWYIGNPKDVPAPPVFHFADLEGDVPIKMAPVKLDPVATEPEVEMPAPVLDPASLTAEPKVDEDVAEAEEAPLLPAPLPAAEVVIEQEEIIVPPPPTAAERIASADLAELSHVELIERLAIAMRRREELREAEPASAPSPVVPFPDLADRNAGRLAKAAALSPAGPQETERALRDALAKLQRIGGGA